MIIGTILRHCTSPRCISLRTQIIAVSVLSTLLSSCYSAPQGADSAAQDHEGRGHITFAMGKNDTDKVRPIIQSWNKAHPEEQVELRELAGEADAQRETLVQSLQAGSDDIDVMALDVTWTAEFAANSWLTPLEGDLSVDTSSLLDSTVQSAQYMGRQVALPQSTNGQLLYRDTRKVAEEPRQWSDLVDSCRPILADEEQCLTTQLKQYEGLTVNAVGFMAGWGGGILDESQNSLVNSDNSHRGLEALVSAYQEGIISSSSLGTTEEETNLSFTRGNTAMAINWPYMYGNSMKEDSAVQGHVAVSPLVGDKGVGVSTLGGYNNGINAFSTKKATARDFMIYIISEENQRSFAEASFPPVLASLYDDPELQKEFPYLPALKISLEHAQPRPVTPYYPQVSKAIQDNTYAALTGKKSITEATENMNAIIDNIYAG